MSGRSSRQCPGDGLDLQFIDELIQPIGVDARPAFPDNLPRLRRMGGRIHVNGLYRHGFLLAPALARMAADLVTGGDRPEVMDADHGDW